MHTGTIDIWTIPLDSADHPLDESLALLSEDERSQANRFAFPEIKRRYVLAHAGLRIVLAEYIPEKPGAMRFEINAFGKPALAQGTTHGNIQFNLSHSGELALVAVTRDRPIGVDVEWIKPLADHLKIASRYFAADELDALKNVSASKSQEAFIQLWTGKEAFIKARGEGLNVPFSQFSLATLIEHPGRTSTRVRLPGDRTDWSVYRLKLVDGYLGAVAAAGRVRGIEYQAG
jgi:4'-phosphopantetheinyl transferase